MQHSSAEAHILTSCTMCCRSCHARLDFQVLPDIIRHSNRPSDPSVQPPHCCIMLEHHSHHSKGNFIKGAQAHLLPLPSA